MGVVTIAEPKSISYGKRPFRPNSSFRHGATDWSLSDVSSDLTVEVGSTTFTLHKFPLVSRSGRIRKLLADAKESKITRMNLSGIPGGAEAFELAAKFCYGVNVEVTLSNVAMLNCIAVFLEMTEEISERNLEMRTEMFLKEIVLPKISNSIAVLHCCEELQPLTDKNDIITRLINSIANNACKEQLTSGLLKLDHTFPPNPNESIDEETLSDCWGNSLIVLNLDFFQRVISAVKGKGLKQEIISRILINYAQNSLHGIIPKDPHSVKGGLCDLEFDKKQRLTVETLTRLLPIQSRKGTVPIAFLSTLLKSAIAVSASSSCRSDLERRVSLQLDQAILEDILIPCSHPDGNDPLYDADCVMRIFSLVLHLGDEDGDEDEEGNDLVGEEAGTVYDFNSPGSPKHSTIIKVSKLLDSYLAEVALDPNMTPSKFIALAELLPDHARLSCDGLYRAVDIYLKVHPHLKDTEKYRLWKTIDCQKMSQEACSHAAQNERLPVQMAVQVLYFEQIRLRNAMNSSSGYNSSHAAFNGSWNFPPHRNGSAAGSTCISPRDNYASVRRENRELKLEVARMRMRLTDLEKDHISMKADMVRPHRANKFLKSLTKKLCKINGLFRVMDPRNFGGKANSESRSQFQKRRRHSVS
ncbi:unnamed protein product [Cuscuta europaea]|uniref:Phototropic-responsive NPH3 family protein n=1 Tax=Cuscuta europaea TaxID=41803 RepID=A0A9P1EFZ4_CUSEU|nr:unnamed protein product [Cuscuta europaea]